MITLEKVQDFWGSRFDPSALAPQFNGLEGRAVTVCRMDGSIVSGTISVTGGWQPVYVLLPTETDGRGWIPLGFTDEEELQ